MTEQRVTMDGGDGAPQYKYSGPTAPRFTRHLRHLDFARYRGLDPVERGRFCDIHVGAYETGCLACCLVTQANPSESLNGNMATTPSLHSRIHPLLYPTK